MGISLAPAPCILSFTVLSGKDTCGQKMNAREEGHAECIGQLLWGAKSWRQRGKKSASFLANCWKTSECSARKQAVDTVTIVGRII